MAKLDRNKLNKEQTLYMPKIPDIAKCPEHLTPLKKWEDAFLADFTELRAVCFLDQFFKVLNIGIKPFFVVKEHHGHLLIN